MAVTVSEGPYRPERRPRSIIAMVVGALVAICAIVPYALIALGLRLIIARVFFLSGQLKITGPVIAIPYVVTDGQFEVTLLANIKPETYALFARDYAALPMSPTVAATLFTYAEFLLPVCLVLGFATRLSALALLAMTVLIQVYVAPEAFWSAHVYLIAILMVLMTVGPGALSFDALLRYVYQK